MRWVDMVKEMSRRLLNNYSRLTRARTMMLEIGRSKEVSGYRAFRDLMLAPKEYPKTGQMEEVWIKMNWCREEDV